MSAETFRIEGMTCDHCVRAVTMELLMVPGVASVDVSLEAGTATVRSEAPLPREAVRDAVEEAGYTLA